MSQFFDKSSKFRIVYFSWFQCIVSPALLHSLNAKVAINISKIIIVSPQQINCISKSMLYLLSVNIVSPVNYF